MGHSSVCFNDYFYLLKDVRVEWIVCALLTERNKLNSSVVVPAEVENMFANWMALGSQPVSGLIQLDFDDYLTTKESLNFILMLLDYVKRSVVEFGEITPGSYVNHIPEMALANYVDFPTKEWLKTISQVRSVLTGTVKNGKCCGKLPT